MNKINHIIYTFKHIVCINILAMKYKVWTPKYLLHDADKLIMYMFCFRKSVKQIHYIHRMRSNHHVENMDKKKIDWEMVIMDWESARFTKKDKPLNAYDTMMKYYPQCVEYCFPIMKSIGLI